jgi:superfamily II DNA helicase RecQ
MSITFSTGSGSQGWKEAYSNLKDYFGYTSFRSGQETAIGAAFDKKDSLVVMATGMLVL